MFSFFTVTIYWKDERPPTVHTAANDSIDIQQGPSCLRISVQDKADGKQHVYYYPWESMDHTEVEMR